MSNDAAMMDVHAMLREEDCALGMGPMSNDAALMDVLIMSSVEECALDMGQRLNSNDAAVRDAQS